MKARRETIIAAVISVLAGCAIVAEPPATAPVERPSPVAKVAPTPPPVPVSPPAPQVARASDVDALISEFGRMRRLSAPELAREQELARHVFNQSRTDASRVRLALAMGVHGGSGSDTALELLDPLVRNSAAPLHGLAFLLSSYIQEQRRLASQLQSLQQNVQGLQQNVNALQQKLDALRTLERSLTEREAGARRR